MELTKETPGPDGRGARAGVDWRAVAERLRAEPGEWFVVAERAARSGRMLASRLKLGHVAGWNAGEFDVVGRATGAATVKVHARYVGGDA